MGQMQTYTVHRNVDTVSGEPLGDDEEREFEFEGVRIGHASSERPDVDRYFELDLYRTDEGDYVAHGQGRSRIPGEDTLEWFEYASTAHGVISSLYRWNSRGEPYLTTTARIAIQEAALEDDEFATYLDRRARASA